MLASPPLPDDYVAFLADAHRRFGQEGRQISPSVNWRTWLSGKQRRPRKPWRELLTAAVKETQERSGMVLEFGVHRANSTNLLAALLPDETIHGFDSFQGFPDDGRDDWDRNFALDGVPAVAKNVKLHQGFFADTLPPFVGEYRDELSRRGIRLLHIDCDIYSSTVTVFENLEPFIVPGTVIVFDELMHYDRFATNEFLAFYEFLTRSGLGFEWCVTIGKSASQDMLAQWPSGRVMRDWRRDGYHQNQAVRIIRA